MCCRAGKGLAQPQALGVGHSQGDKLQMATIALTSTRLVVGHRSQCRCLAHPDFASGGGCPSHQRKWSSL